MNFFLNDFNDFVFLSILYTQNHTMFYTQKIKGSKEQKIKEKAWKN